MNVEFSNEFKKDFEKALKSNLYKKIEKLLFIIEESPFASTPPYEKLSGFKERYSRRINKKHRIVYEIENNTIRFLKCWSHYE